VKRKIVDVLERDEAEYYKGGWLQFLFSFCSFELNAQIHTSLLLVDLLTCGPKRLRERISFIEEWAQELDADYAQELRRARDLNILPTS